MNKNRLQSPHSKKVLGAMSDRGPFCVVFVCPPCVCVGSLWVIQLPPRVRRGQVNWANWGCLSLHVSRVNNE